MPKDIETVEQLFHHKYPEVFETINLSDLKSISDKVLIIIDGLDELQNVYDFDKDQRPVNLDLLSSLIDTKHGILSNHKVIACGRPKACYFVKQQFEQKSKTIEVAGFNSENINKYIGKFFIDNEEKAREVREALSISDNLKVMATVPVFLWIICCVYSEGLITKPLNTYTELYIYATLIFLRNHFRGNSSLHKNMLLIDIVNNGEIMNSVYALMSLSVQTYMKNKVLFNEEDIKRLTCSTQLENTGFIVKHISDGREHLRKPVYQFKHLVLQEFLCSLSLCISKKVSPYRSNTELLRCAPVIFGIQRLLKEGDNEIFISFFRGLSTINRSRMKFFTRYIRKPYRKRVFRRFLKENCIEIPQCMVKNDKLVINTSQPECQSFLTLSFESKVKLQCPFSSCQIDGDVSQTNFRSIISLLNELNLKIAISENMIDGDKLLINTSSSIIGRFISGGAEIEQCSSITSAKFVGVDSEDYENALILLNHMKLKITIPESMIKDCDTFVISKSSSIFGRFVSDGIEIEQCSSFTYAEVVGYLQGSDYENALKLLNHLKLEIQIPQSFIVRDTLAIDDFLSIICKFISNGIKVKQYPSLTFALISKLPISDYNNMLILLKRLSLKIKIPENVIEDGETFVINQSSSIFGQFISDGIEIEQCSSITAAKIDEDYISQSAYNDVLVLLRYLKLKIKIPDTIDDGFSSKLISDGIEIYEF